MGIYIMVYGKLIEEEALKRCLNEGVCNFKGDNKIFVDILNKEGMFEKIATLKP